MRMCEELVSIGVGGRREEDEVDTFAILFSYRHTSPHSALPRRCKSSDQIRRNFSEEEVEKTSFDEKERARKRESCLVSLPPSMFAFNSPLRLISFYTQTIKQSIRSQLVILIF